MSLLNQSASVPAPVVQETTLRPGQATIWRTVRVVLLVVIAFFMLMPFVWLVTSSLKTQVNIFQYPPQWIPDPVMWENFPNALTAKPFGLYFRNTAIIVALNVLAVVFSG